MKYAWITKHRDSFPVVLMCELLSVSRSGYYDSLDRLATSGDHWWPPIRR